MGLPVRPRRSRSLGLLTCMLLGYLPSCGARSPLLLPKRTSQLADGGGGGLAGAGTAGSGTGTSGANFGGMAGRSGAGAAGLVGVAGLAGGAGLGGGAGSGATAGLGGVAGSAGASADLVPPRLIAPLSTARVTSQRPTLRWSLADGTDGAQIELCADRTCATILAQLDAAGASLTLPNPLPAGVMFWRAFARSGSKLGRTASPTWEFWVGHLSATIDTSWGSVLDANLDGYADAMLSALDMGGGATPAGIGHAYLYLGGANGLSSTAAQTFDGSGSASQFGTSIGNVDVNGDGMVDLLVGAPGSSGHAAYLYLGTPDGFATSPSATFAPDTASSRFGASASGAGDIDGDGYGDLIVGAPNAPHGSAGAEYKGSAYVYFGSANGIDTTRTAILGGATSYSSTFGLPATGAGDIDGDGYADLLIGGAEGIPLSPGSYLDQGRVYSFRGGAPFTDSAWAMLHAPSEQTALTIGGGGDFNADGYADLVVGALGETTQLLGRPGGYGAGGTLMMPFVQQPNTTSAYAYRVVAAGDLDGDGYDEAVGSYASIYVYRGGPNGAADPPAIFTPPGQSASIYGYEVHRVGDLNGDGYDDVILGARFDTQFTGRAYVYLGSASGLSTMPVLVLVGADGIGGYFG